jgi:hypothetical protein
VVVLTTGGTSPVAASAGTRTVVVDDTTSFARAWNRAMTSTPTSKVAKAAKAAAGTSS